MSINSPRMAAGSTAQRTLQRDGRVKIVPAKPGTPYQDIVDDEVVTFDNLPLKEGQLVIHWASGQPIEAVYQMYCAVNIGGDLQWKLVKLGTGAVDVYTQRPMPTYSDQMTRQF